MNNKMIHKQKFPSPHPGIELSIVTFDANGLKVKGLLAEPKDDQSMMVFSIYGEELKMLGW